MVSTATKESILTNENELLGFDELLSKSVRPKNKKTQPKFPVDAIEKETVQNIDYNIFEWDSYDLL